MRSVPRCDCFVWCLALLSFVDLAIDEGVLAVGAAEGMVWLDAHERTLLRGVKQLLPGHAMEVLVAGGRVEILRTFCYWTADIAARRPYGTESGDDELREFHSKFEAALRAGA